MASTTASATHIEPEAKKEGNIADSFVSLLGGDQPPLPDSYRRLKLDLTSGREDQVIASWGRLLAELRRENEIIAQKGPAVIPQVDYAQLESGLEELRDEIKLRGAVVVRGVVPEAEARAYKHDIDEYVRKNPWTKAYPPNNPQVYELYWSSPQLKARSHPNLLHVQRQLMTSLWHTSSPSAEISLSHPLSYADRLRIRQPGDTTFALGPHQDGGSVERWERGGYALGGVYDRIFEGRHAEYDPWDASGRVAAVTNTHNGLGACSVFRTWQGWLSMSRGAPGEGTLLVNPLMRLSTAYTLLRPFFRPKDEGLKGTPAFLDADNWVFTAGDEMTSELQGATPGHGQEYTDELHPHLELDKTMVHIPHIRPGDFVAWHCDTIHAVDKIHEGTSDSSVLYIPVCPVTELNATYFVRQREAFRTGLPGPDFPGGEGEARHEGRWTEGDLGSWVAGGEGMRAMGLEKLVVDERDGAGGREVVEKANAILGF